MGRPRQKFTWRSCCVERGKAPYPVLCARACGGGGGARRGESHSTRLLAPAPGCLSGGRANPCTLQPTPSAETLSLSLSARCRCSQRAGRRVHACDEPHPNVWFPGAVREVARVCGSIPGACSDSVGGGARQRALAWCMCGRQLGWGAACVIAALGLPRRRDNTFCLPVQLTLLCKLSSLCARSLLAVSCLHRAACVASAPGEGGVFPPRCGATRSGVQLPPAALNDARARPKPFFTTTNPSPTRPP
jgi:hypothetical protein